jgi:hypothetical protein
MRSVGNRFGNNSSSFTLTQPNIVGPLKRDQARRNGFERLATATPATRLSCETSASGIRGRKITVI